MLIHPLPSRTNPLCVSGTIYHYENVELSQLVASGILLPGELPTGASSRSQNGRVYVHRKKNGRHNVKIDADIVLSRSTSFKKFLGGLLADSSLSLVKGEVA